MPPQHMPGGAHTKGPKREGQGSQYNFTRVSPDQHPECTLSNVPKEPYTHSPGPCKNFTDPLYEEIHTPHISGETPNNYYTNIPIYALPHALFLPVSQGASTNPVAKMTTRHSCHLQQQANSGQAGGNTGCHPRGSPTRNRFPKRSPPRY